MKLRGAILALLVLCALAPVAIAQPKLEAASGDRYLPRLGDIMNAVQARHTKLWLAFKAQNWELAAYELRQFRAGLLEAAVLYEGIPVTNVTTMAAPIEATADAIGARDGGRFAKAFGELTAGCNACHGSMGRGFIVIQTPTASLFGDQSFAPPKKP